MGGRTQRGNPAMNEGKMACADYRAAGVATAANEREHLLGGPHQLFEGLLALGVAQPRNFQFSEALS
jgi:hypothetical protein